MRRQNEHLAANRNTCNQEPPWQPHLLDVFAWVKELPASAFKCAAFAFVGQNARCYPAPRGTHTCSVPAAGPQLGEVPIVNQWTHHHAGGSHTSPHLRTERIPMLASRIAHRRSKNHALQFPMLCSCHRREHLAPSNSSPYAPQTIHSHHGRLLSGRSLHAFFGGEFTEISAVVDGHVSSASLSSSCRTCSAVRFNRTKAAICLCQMQAAASV